MIPHKNGIIFLQSLSHEPATPAIDVFKLSTVDVDQFAIDMLDLRRSGLMHEHSPYS